MQTLKNLILTCLALLPHSSFGASCYVDEANGRDLVCANDNQSTELTVRRLESWNGNAGLMLIEMCPMKAQIGHSKPLTVLEETEADYLDRTSTSKNLECIRRFCTDDIRGFSLQINHVFIPFTYAIGMAVSFGVHSQRIEVRCQSITEEF